MTVGGGSRRTVTVLFADMVESTALGERLDPEALRAIQVRYFAALREVVERHGGVVEKYIGDAVMAVFGVPAAHEDDALRAVRAASELGASLTSLSDDLQRRRGVHLELRIGVHTGAVVVTDGDGAGTLVTGDTVNTAARLQQAASPGDTLLGPTTYDLVRDAVEVEELEPLALKGKATEVRAHRLVAVTGMEGRARRADTPLVGRGVEIDHLEGRLQETIEGRAPRLVTVLGTAGVGKSRLVREFATSVTDRATVVRGRCLSYGDGITYWPVVEILRALAGIVESDDAAAIHVRLDGLVAGIPGSERLATVLEAIVGVSDAPTVGDDVSWAVRRVFEAVARRSPLVVIIEDIHWAEPALLDLIEAVVEWTSGVPLLVLCLARPEIIDRRPLWGAGGRGSEIALEPLGSSVAEDLLLALPGGTAIPGAVRDRVLAVAEGNPLYLEELVAKLFDEGALTQIGPRWEWSGDVDQVEIPATVHALVAARIDGLAPLEQRVAERASIVGRVFERGAVAALDPDGGGRSVGAPLLALIRKQLVRPDGSGLDGDAAFRFRHIIIRDVAYERMPKAERAELHERFAGWLESILGDRAIEYVEIIAHHLAEAAEYAAELDSLSGPAGRRLLDRALSRLTEAAERADRLHAYGQAARLFDRAASMVGASEPGASRGSRATVDLKRRAADADALAGNVEAAAQRIRDLVATVGAADPILRGSLFERLAAFTRDLGDEAGTIAAIEEAIRVLPTEPPSLERARALAGYARFLMLDGRDKEALDACQAALDAADIVGAPTVRVGALVTLGTALGGLGRETEAISFLERAHALATEIGDGPGLIRATNNMGAVIKDPERSEPAIMETIDRLPALGLERSSDGMSLRVNVAIGMIRTGRLRAAEAVIEQALELEPSGNIAVEALTMHGWVLGLRARWDEANAALARARDHAGHGALRRSLGDLCWVEAHAAILDGRIGEAIALLREGSPYIEGGSLVVEYAWLELLVAVAQATEARRSGDDAAERGSIDSARRIVGQIRGLAVSLGGAMPWVSQHVMLLLAAELDRATGTSDPDVWQAAADELELAHFRWDAAYALYRRAEAVTESSATGSEIAEAIETATTAAAAIGADGIVQWTAELRARPGR